MITLRCRAVAFYSSLDEVAFFAFAERIKGVRRVEGVGDSILLHTSRRVSEAGLRDLIALFQRYRISMSQLSQFVTPANRAWFKNSNAYWYGRVFGPRSPQGHRRSG